MRMKTHVESNACKIRRSHALQCSHVHTSSIARIEHVTRHLPTLMSISRRSLNQSTSLICHVVSLSKVARHTSHVTRHAAVPLTLILCSASHTAASLLSMSSVTIAMQRTLHVKVYGFGVLQRQRTQRRAFLTCASARCHVRRSTRRTAAAAPERNQRYIVQTRHTSRVR